MRYELTVYFGCNGNEANSFSCEFKFENPLAFGDDFFDCDGYYEAGDEDGTMWRLEFMSDLEEEIEINKEEIVNEIKKVVSEYPIDLANIVLLEDADNNDDREDLFVNENFFYYKK